MIQETDWLDSYLVGGDPNPGSFLGFATDPTDASGVLTMEDLHVFLCHTVRRHVMYYHEESDGKHYECLECSNGI